MNWNSSTEKKLSKQRQLEENRRSTKDASTSLAQTSFTKASVEENEQMMKEPSTVLESQEVSNFYVVDEENLIIFTPTLFPSKMTWKMRFSPR